MPLHLVFSLILLLWAGMVLGISCLEAWVKFRAPSLTKAVGLDVGRTVFRAFHRVQWGLLIILLVCMFITLGNSPYVVVPLGIGILLSIQTFWLFPPLCRNIEFILAGNKPRKNLYHHLYSVAELGKLLLLLGSGICLMVA